MVGYTAGDEWNGRQFGRFAPAVMSMARSWIKQWGSLPFCWLSCSTTTPSAQTSPTMTGQSHLITLHNCL